MYAFIRGTLEEKNIESIVVEAGGVGYEIHISSSTFDDLPNTGEEVRIYTYLQILDREGSMILYGFSSLEEKQLFLSLITVSGVGPKMAMTILSGINPRDLSIALYNKDANTIGKIKGVGKKTAERIVVDLAGKESVNLFNFEKFQNVSSKPASSTAVDEAIFALVDMGLSKFDATNLVHRVMNPDDTTEEIVAKALRNMG